MSNLIVLAIFLVVGYGFGTYAENRHYRSIRQRERDLRHIYVVATKYPPVDNPPPESTLVAGNVVISVDYFKRFLAGLRNLWGGRVSSYETLLDRARREAVLRMKAQAAALGAAYIFNIKFQTMSIYQGRRNSVGSVEVLAYGTALYPARPGSPS